MKILFIFISLLVFAGCTSKKTDIDCQKFRNGRFKLIDEPLTTSYIITRNDSIQTELDLESNITSRFRVKWIDECSYKTLYLDQDKMESDLDSATAAIFEEIKKAPTIITITTTGEDYYIFKARVNDQDLKYSDTIWVMK